MGTNLRAVVVGLMWAGVCCAQPAPDASKAQPTPIVEGHDATFVAAGSPDDPPRIVADFNGWDAATGVMKRDGATGLYTLRVRLDPAARIEYLIAYRDRFDVDPRNPVRVPSPTGAPRSELRMPRYQPPAPLPPPPTPGTTETIPFTSRAGEPRRIRVHRPAGATGPLPILYFHDGIIAAEELGVPAMIDSLVASGQMAPVTAVFVSSVDRHEDYAAGSMFSYVFTGEIIPLVETKYPAAQGGRSVFGLSRSAVGALDVAVNGDVTFARAALVAPAIAAPVAASILRSPQGRVPRRVAILTGKYDRPLTEDAHALRKILEARQVPVDWFEVPEGHNHTAWKTLLPRLLTSWYPGAAGTRPDSPRVKEQR